MNMKTLPIWIALLALPLCCLADTDATANVDVKDLGKDAYRLTYTSSDVTDTDTVQAALVPLAQKLCGDKTPQFGKYTSDKKQAVDKPGKPTLLTFAQDISCGGAGTVTWPSKPPETAYQPSQADQKAVIQAADKFFAAENDADYIGSYAYLDAAMKAVIPFKNWMQQNHDFNTQAGAAVDRKIVAVSWAKDPPDALAEGIYVTLDFVGTAPNFDTDCGFLAWYRLEDGSFRIIREEENYLTKDTVKKMTAAQIAAAKKQFACVGE